MRCVAFGLMPLALACFGLTSVFAARADGAVAGAAAEGGAARRGGHGADLPLPRRIKRQAIRIPGSVSKLRIVQPPLNLRSNRAPQQFSRLPTKFRGGAVWSPPLRKSQTDFGFRMDGSFPFDPKKVKRNLRRLRTKEVSAEEFYHGEPDLEEERREPKKGNKHKLVVKMRRKRPKQTMPGELWADHGREVGEEVRFAEAEEGPFLGFGAAAPTFDMKRLPTKGRQMQSLFAQQYTTHNPHVATNFGLGAPQQHAAVPFGAKDSSANADRNGPLGDRYGPPVPAASDHSAISLPAKTPGIQLVQPPQFRDATASHPSHPSRLTSSQTQQRGDSSSHKATMRDILDQDCPSHDVTGYCDSPPRYPMQQIKGMVKKCSVLMEAMNTQPFEEPQEPQRVFAKRADNPAARSNASVSVDLGADSHLSSWSRSAREGLSPCHSEVEVIEPGYAKEVHSGKWFVIVQQPETTIQRIATDTCRNPGKPCGGLSQLKCAKVGGLGGRATRCVQRHTSQRLISWDPESPEDCPRMRVFRFPSACTCHWDVGL